jgi:Ca2+-binding RTX toxin-like protein
MAVIYADGSSEVDGTSGRDTIYGDAQNNYVFAYQGNDKIYGRGGNDQLSGAAGADRIFGDAGNDVISGGAGRDTLTGGSGRDEFDFDERPSSANCDTITDFRPSADTIVLYLDYFKKAGSGDGFLKSSAFWKGAAAHDADDRIIYDNTTGAVYYDPDGTGAQAQVMFAKVSKGLSITYKNFYVLDWGI